MALDPRDLPAVGDELAGGVVARTVATAEGLEVTVRMSTVDYPGYTDEDRPVSIPQTVDPSAHDNEGSTRAAEADEAEEADRKDADAQVKASVDQRETALKETAKAPAAPAKNQAKGAGK